MPDVKTNMTVEDRLAEKLKGAEFAAWFGEDDLRELVSKALDRAFFAPRRDVTGYHSRDLPPLLVELATKQLTDKVDALVLKAVAAEFAKDPAILERLVAKALDEGLEALVLRAIGKGLAVAMGESEFGIQGRIVEMLRSGSLR